MYVLHEVDVLYTVALQACNGLVIYVFDYNTCGPENEYINQHYIFTWSTVVCTTHFDVYAVGFFIEDEKNYEQGKSSSEQKQQQANSSFHH